MKTIVRVRRRKRYDKRLLACFDGIRVEDARFFPLLVKLWFCVRVVGLVGVRPLEGRGLVSGFFHDIVY